MKILDSILKYVRKQTFQVISNVNSSYLNRIGGTKMKIRKIVSKKLHRCLLIQTDKKVKIKKNKKY